MPDPAPNDGPPLIRALGLLAGDLWCGITGQPRVKKEDPKVVRHDVVEETLDTPQGKVVLRRTTIEEVVVDPDQP